MKSILPFKAFIINVMIACCMLAAPLYESKALAVPPVSNNMARVDVIFKQDIQKNELTIRIKSGSNIIMQFFIFSPEGELIKEVAVSARTTTRIKGLERGFYLYECFNEDERMKSGSIKIK